MAFIQSEFNIADGLTKVKKIAVLLETLLTCRLDHFIEQWIIRNSKGDSVFKNGGVSLD